MNISGFLLVFRNAFRAALGRKRLLIFALLAGLPILMAVVHVAKDKHVTPNEIAEVFLLALCQVTVPFGALFLGVAALGDEVDGRTITFLFTRPLPRPVFLLGRLFGFGCAYAIVVALSTWLLVQIYSSRFTFSGAQVTALTAIAVGGLLAYMAFFAALRVMTRRALFVGFGIVFVIEGVLSKMPTGSLARVSIWHHLSVLTFRTFGGQAKREDLFAFIEPTETVSGSVMVLVGTLLVSLFVGVWLVKTREINVPAAVG